MILQYIYYFFLAYLAGGIIFWKKDQTIAKKRVKAYNERYRMSL